MHHKLTSAERRHLPVSSFCGPHRSFPVTDHAHAVAARRLIGRAHVTEAVRKQILACVARKDKQFTGGK